MYAQIAPVHQYVMARGSLILCHKHHSKLHNQGAELFVSRICVAAAAEGAAAGGGGGGVGGGSRSRSSSTGYQSPKLLLKIQKLELPLCLSTTKFSRLRDYMLFSMQSIPLC
jgi:hypothetical protein